MMADYVVVGAGIAGASVAYHLALQGQVLLLERESQPGYHSTGRSAAMFMETYGTAAIRALTRASRAFYEQPPAHFTDHPILTPRGAMHVAKTGQESELASAWDAATQSSSRVELLSVPEVLERCPVLRAELTCGAIYEPDAMDMDVHALHQGYLRGFRARGGQVMGNAELASAQRGPSGWMVVLVDGRTLQAP
ncbi:MAG: FAD-binding oxidoreductase, partial [Burkholderiales bacterium]